MSGVSCGSDSVKRFKVLFLSSVLVIAIAAALCFLEKYEVITWSGSAWARSRAPRIGVVDFTKLLKEHHDWKKLEGIDKKIADMEQKMYNAPSVMEKLGAEHVAKMQKAQQQAEGELKAELAKIQSELDRQKAAVQAQIGEELKRAEAQMKELQKQAQKTGGELSPEDAGKSYPQQMKEFSEDLLKLRDRQLTAKKLELQKRAKERVDVEKNRLDSSLSAYEQQISRENQQEKLNIQLKLQITKDDEEYAQLQSQLNRLQEEESKLKEKKKAEVAAEVDKLGDAEMSKVEKELDEYKKKIDTDIKAQLNAKQSQITGRPVAVSSEYQKKGMQLAKAFEQKKKELEARLTSAQSESLKKLEAKKSQLQQELQAQEKSLMKEAMKNKDRLAQNEMERMNKEKLNIDALKEEREKLYESMMADIKEKVSELAVEEHVPFVVGTYVVNISGIDLTDKAIKKISQSGK